MNEKAQACWHDIQNALALMIRTDQIINVTSLHAHLKQNNKPWSPAQILYVLTAMSNQFEGLKKYLYQDENS